MTAAGGWREEARRDRLVRAQIDRDRHAARAQLRTAGRQARASQRRTSAQARAAWVRAHTLGLLFVPVIIVPAVLAWTAMAAYGSEIYGPPGRMLPAFSEGAMWAFAAATTITRRRHPGRPVWHLRAGTVVFAGYGAALNFAHGLATAGGPVAGMVYAAVSVAGVTAHQLITAGPRRSAAERDDARIARAAARRERAARRAAVRRATADVDARGRARLVYRTGPAGAGLAAAGPSCPWPGPAPVLPAAPGRPAPAPAPGSAPALPGAPAPEGAPAPRRTRTRTRRAGAPRTRDRTRAPAGGVTNEAAEVHFAADLAKGQVPSARRIKADLHVGQDRAAAIRDHLAAVAAAPGGQGPRELSRRTA